jgi:signal transduction histidine kinase/ligand-binding sensor domain-containing protein
MGSGNAARRVARRLLASIPATASLIAASLIAASLIAATAALAAGPPVERIGQEGGPVPDVVTALCLERSGLLWVGSRSGLLLFDGQSVRSFEHDTADPQSISDNAIRAIYEDRAGSLWVGTNSGGLDRLDRARSRFEHFRHDAGDPGSLSHDSVYAILEDRGGALWVGTQQGLNRLDPGSRTFHRFPSNPADPNALASDYILSLYEDTKGRLWIGTFGGGLSRWEPERQAFTTFRHHSDDPRSLNDDRVSVLREDQDGVLWVGTVLGLSRMDPRDATFRRFPQGGSVAVPLVKALAPGRAGKMWVGTHTGGLEELDLRSGALRPWPQVRAQQIEALMVDPDGAVWIGTWGNGLRRLSSTALLLAAGAETARIPADLENADLTSMLTDRRGAVWYGTTAGVLRRVDSPGGTGPAQPRPVGGETRSILSMAEDDAGRIWVGSNLDLARMDVASGRTTTLRHDPRDPASIGPGYVKAVMKDRRGAIWIGTGEGGVQRLDPEGRVVARYVQDPADPASLSDNYVTALHEDAGGTLWVGTRSGGLDALEIASGKCTRFLPDAGDPRSLSHHCVTGILEDRAGRLWIATAGGGLNEVERRPGERPRFRRITEDDGLIDNDVMAMLEDDDGSLWLSTRRGVARFNPPTGEFLSLHTSDGLPSAEFEVASATRSAGLLHFGSIKGPIAVPAGSPFPVLRPSPMIVTSIRTPSGDVRGDRPAWGLDHVAIRYGEWLALEMAVLDYSPEHKNRFAYRLQGPWIDLGPGQAITFTGLKPGTYTFSARGRNTDGVWSPPTPDLRIEVIPPFWMTLWFRGAGILTLVALAFAGHRLRLSVVERRSRALLVLHEQRERAQSDLGAAYERLRHLARRLEAAKEDERLHIARELHDELGPSLTAVIINLQLLARNPAAAATADRIHDAIELVDRLVQRVRDLSLNLRPPLLDELGLSAALRGYLEAQAERTGLSIPVRIATSVERLPGEVEIHAFRIVQEAVTNAIRHAAASRVQVRVGRDGDDLMLAVQDDGRGFDVQRTMESSSGKALGLLGMHERVRSLGGEIVIESGGARGTEIRVRIPLGRAA